MVLAGGSRAWPFAHVWSFRFGDRLASRRKCGGNMLTRRSALVSLFVGAVAVSGCAAPTSTRAPASASVTASVPRTPLASDSQISTSAVGDRDAISRCQNAETSQQASFASAGASVPALSVVAGYDTTVGIAQSYANSIGAGPGTAPKPIQTDTSQDGAAVVVCLLDGTIEGPGPGGPYTRELAKLAADGTIQVLVLANPSQLSLSRPGM